ncbi:flavodoxin family protein [Microcella flavibacter]|uniref:flavodoxin family protein n=1 Tax=Microcella flavibacter TaxID=1804990 RepID=UPI001457076A|nr:flavodoxin family protein [Microcella flavibacter]
MNTDTASPILPDPARFGDLRAVVVNTTLKRSPELSNTQGLLDRAVALLQANGVEVDIIRLVDHDVAPGVQPDMREQGWPDDAWPDLWPRIHAADILIVGSPIWLGEQSSVTRRLIERLYAHSSELEENGLSVFHGTVGGALVTGNEDGVKHVASSITYSLQHLGVTVPPTADAGWIGPVGPGPSYLDEGSGGPQTDFTNQGTTFMVYNLLHLARLLKDAGGFPVGGNQPGAWSEGERFGFDDSPTPNQPSADAREAQQTTNPEHD